jgi:ribosomal protein S27AE
MKVAEGYGVSAEGARLDPSHCPVCRLLALDVGAWACGGYGRCGATLNILPRTGYGCLVAPTEFQHRRGPALDQSDRIPVASSDHSNGRVRAELTGTGRTVKCPELMSVSYRPTSDAAGHGNFEQP